MDGAAENEVTDVMTTNSEEGEMGDPIEIIVLLGLPGSCKGTQATKPAEGHG